MHHMHDRQQRLYIMTLGVQAAYRGRGVGAYVYLKFLISPMANVSKDSST